MNYNKKKMYLKESHSYCGNIIRKERFDCLIKSPNKTKGVEKKVTKKTN